MTIQMRVSIHCLSSRKGSKYPRLSHMLYLKCIRRKLHIETMAIKRISSRRNVLSKHFQKYDSYCLFIQLNQLHSNISVN